MRVDRQFLNATTTQTSHAFSKMENTRDDKALMYVEWNGVGTFTVRVQCRATKAFGSSQQMAIRSFDQSYCPTSGYTPGAGEDDPGPYSYASFELQNASGTGTGSYGLHYYVPKFPEMRVALTAVSGATVSAYLIH